MTVVNVRDTLVPAYQAQLDQLAYDVASAVNTAHQAGFENVVFDLFSWNEGTFSFADGTDDDVRVDASVRVSIESLLMEGARRIDEWSRMNDRIPGAHVIPRLAEVREKTDSYIDLRPAEWEVLTLIDGRHSLRDIDIDIEHDAQGHRGHQPGVGIAPHEGPHRQQLHQQPVQRTQQ